MQGGFDFGSMLPIVLIFVVMYFLIIRPQNKKAKLHRELIASLGKGSRVLINGGLIGTIYEVLDQELVLEVAKDVRVHVSRGMVASVLDKTSTSTTKPVGPAPKKMIAKKSSIKK